MKLKFILTILSVVALWAPFSTPVYAQEEPEEATEAPPIEGAEEEADRQRQEHGQQERLAMSQLLRVSHGIKSGASNGIRNTVLTTA